jgi:hypothetical protein
MDRTKLSVFDFVRLTRFGDFNLTSTIILAVLTLGLWGTSRVEAGIVINTPVGLNPGDTFRIAFVTDTTTTATLPTIADYNDFVNADATTEAGGGSVTYKGNAITFSAIGSTEAVSAISNIGQTGAPVYLVDGTPIASSDTLSSGGLWSGTIINPLNEDLTANVFGPLPVWTGTRDNGDSVGGAALGDTVTTDVVGITSETDLNWVATSALPFTRSNPMYGISAVLTVPTPEPSSIVLLMIAAGCGSVGAYVRRRKARCGR